MKFFRLKMPWSEFLKGLRISLIGAAVAGAFGIVHDQISYSISPAFYDYVKFRQFSYLDLGLPTRVFVAEIGIMASWWVGLVGGWFLARMGLYRLVGDKRRLAQVLLLTIGTTVAFGIAGAAIGFLRSSSDLGEWVVWNSILSTEDVRRLITVTYLHNATYLGALFGTIVACVCVRLWTRELRRSEP